MTPDKRAELRGLFEQAINFSLAERSRLLEESRARDPELAEQLAALLAAHGQATQTADLPLVGYQRPLDRLFSVGEVVLDRFEIIRLLGTGGMGEVYEANDREMGRIALKTVRGGAYSSKHDLARLRQEVAIARGISSLNVCRLYEFFPIPSEPDRPGFACFTMEFLDGVTVSSHIKQHGALPWGEARRFAMQICDGLTAIHRAGVVHRDLKCGNIMLVTREGQVDAVIMDFGLARKPEVASLRNMARAEYAPPLWYRHVPAPVMSVFPNAPSVCCLEIRRGTPVAPCLLRDLRLGQNFEHQRALRTERAYLHDVCGPPPHSAAYADEVHWQDRNSMWSLQASGIQKYLRHHRKPFASSEDSPAGRLFRPSMSGRTRRVRGQLIVWRNWIA